MPLFDVFSDNIFNVSIDISGISKAKHKPLAEATPILNPVYDPGPLLTDIADKSFGFNFEFFKTESIKTCKDFEWE